MPQHVDTGKKIIVYSHSYIQSKPAQYIAFVMHLLLWSHALLTTSPSIHL